MSLHLLEIEGSGLVSEVPNVLLVGQYLMVECHGRLSVNGTDQRATHAVPDGVYAEGYQDAGAMVVGLVEHLLDGVVDEVFEHRQLGVNLGLVLVIEVNNGLHARRLAIDAGVVKITFYIQVVVEALIELLHNGIETIVTQDLASALGMELVGNHLYHFRNIPHGTVGIALEVGSL